MKKFVVSLVIMLFIFGSFTTNEKGFSISPHKNFKDFSINEEGEYSTIEIEGCNYIHHAGYPMLPYYTKVYTFPAGTKINFVEVKAKNVETIHINKKIVPAMPPLPLNMQTNEYKIEEGEIYEKDEFYPSDWFDYNIGMGIKDGKHVVFLSIHLYPALYNAVRNEIIYADDFDISIDYDLPSSLPFVNDKYDLLIIAPDKWIDALQQLKQHKESHGIRTVIAGLNEIYSGKYFSIQGRDSAEKIKYFIKDAIEQWGIKYVMLVGGRQFGVKEKWFMPVRYAYAIDNVPPFTENGFLSDLYFADVYKYEDGNIAFDDWDSNGNGIFAEYNNNGRYDDVDLYPDVYVGRLPCRNKIELETVIKKIINYEKIGGREKRIILCGGDTDLNDKDDLNEGEYSNEKIAEIMSDFECIKLWASNNMLSRKNFFKEIMKGAMFIDFSGHGSPNSWATHPHNSDEWIGITIFDIFFYFNGNKLPVIFANACHTAQFNLSYECFGWGFVKKIGGGGIAFIGSTGLSYGFGGYDTVKSLSGYLEINFFKNYYNSTFLCEMFHNAIINYLNNIPMDDWQDFKTVEEYVLLGLPCLEINL